MLLKYNLANLNGWVLADSRMGSNLQAIALAEEMGINFSVVNIKYNLLGNLPNMLLPYGFYHILRPNFYQLIKENTPQIIISASRRTGHISSSIKKILPEVKNIHILRPEMEFANFDCVILPQHDIGFQKKNHNIIRIIGSINDVHRRIDKNINIFNQKYQIFASEPYIAVLVGGDTKEFRFDLEESKKFASTLSRIAFANDHKIFLSCSRRTPRVLKDELRKLESSRVIIYDPNMEDYNPYPALLKNAKFVISACDSISMCSEVATCGKPLYLYKPKLFKSNKHLTFLYQLQDLGIAKLITDNTDFLQEYNYDPLNEAGRIADYVISQLNSVK